jgi:hypothetical protein
LCNEVLLDPEAKVYHPEVVVTDHLRRDSTAECTSPLEELLSLLYHADASSSVVYHNYLSMEEDEEDDDSS